MFGDNIERKGTKGQAQIRNNENAFGIRTKVSPSTGKDAYFDVSMGYPPMQMIKEDIDRIKADGRTVVFPKDGLGTGLAKLKEKAPRYYNYLVKTLQEEFGFNNDTGEISKPTKQVSSSFELNGRVFNVEANHKPGIESIIRELSGNASGVRKVETGEGDNKTRYYVDNKGNRFIGMSSIVNPPDFQDKKGQWTGAIPIGNTVDSILRDFFNGKAPTYKGTLSNGDKFSERITKEAFDDLIKGAKEFKEKTEKTFGKSNVEFITEGLFISDSTITANKSDVNNSVKSKEDKGFKYGFATELDMVIVDKRNGELHLVDFKTQRTQPGENTFRKLTTKYAKKYNPSIVQSKVDGYSKQQNASGIIFNKTSGLEFKSMSLLAVATRYNPFGQKSTTANLKQTVLPLEKESIENVFPENYKKQILGEVTQIGDTLIEKNNQTSVPSESANNVSQDYILDEVETDNVDYGSEDEVHSFAGSTEFDYDNNADFEGLDNDNSSIDNICE